MNAHSLLTQALVYLAAGVISVPIAKRLGLGSVLGYLLSGVLIGPYLLNLVGAPGEVQRFAEFGVVILLFLIGLEVRPALLWKLRTAIFGLGLAQVLGDAALIGAASMIFGLDWRAGAAVGLILAMSSTAIVLQSLEEKGLRQGPVGEASFGVLLFQDLAVIPLFALLPLLAPAGAPTAPAPDHGSSLLSPLMGWAQALAQLAAISAVVMGGRYLTRPMFRFIAAARLFRNPHQTSLTTAVALAQGGEFAFVLLGFVLGARVMDAELARLLTAIVAVSMAATPLASAAYERLVLSRGPDLAEPERL